MVRFRSLTLACAFAVPTAWLVLGVRDARACGGCFHPRPQVQVTSTVVTDHRMAFSMSPTQTVLWDQIRYSGSPTEFAWVLPVRQGARIELSQDAWIAALDASTATVIQGPTPNCPATSGGAGCGFGARSTAAPGFANAGPSGDTPPVQVVSQQVIGPYDAVTVRSTQGEALGAWLNANGFDVSSAIQPTIDAYTNEGFDFIALKLRPGYGVQAMQPVRVVTAGADPTLPLRMVAAGVGARVGIVLFVLSEGRYHPKNFPDATIDFSQLVWDPAQQESNYATLADQALAAAGGTGWLTESAQAADLSPYGNGFQNPPLASTYSSTCRSKLVQGRTCGAVGTTDASGGAAQDTGADEDGQDAAETGDGDADVSEGGAGGDGATASEAGACMATAACDDLQLAMTGMTGPLWVTRLRANLPASALASDLVIEATPSQTPAPNVHQTSKYTNPNYSPCPSSPSGSCAAASAASRGRYADAIALALGAVGLALGLRRRQRRPWVTGVNARAAEENGRGCRERGGNDS